MKKFNNDWYICFRGTDSFLDLLTNINFSSLAIAYGNHKSKIRIHRGFYIAYRSVREQILNRLKSDLKSDSKIFISGHSLGASLAVLCSLDIVYNIQQDNVFCLSAGQPKLGNKYFCESTNKRLKNYYRIVNGNDVVTKLPPFIFYKHCGELVEIGEKKFILRLSDHNKSEYYYFLFNCLITLIKESTLNIK
jgi:triacylglycerol lipase